MLKENFFYAIQKQLLMLANFTLPGRAFKFIDQRFFIKILKNQKIMKYIGQ